MLVTLLKMIARLFNYLLPPLCLLCGMKTPDHQTICPGCQADLPILSHSCPQCANLLPTCTGVRCGECLRSPPPFDRTYALFSYHFPIAQVITLLKFHQQLTNAHWLGSLLAEKITKKWYEGECWPDVIIPIPLHLKRLQERGFNQWLEIAKPIARKLGIPLLIKGVRRKKSTLAQSGLNAKARKRNIAGAFQIDHDLTGLTVAVIDDVVTTGQTCREFSALLRKKGAKNIHIWCCARRTGL